MFRTSMATSSPFRPLTEVTVPFPRPIPNSQHLHSAPVGALQISENGGMDELTNPEFPSQVHTCILTSPRLRGLRPAPFVGAFFGGLSAPPFGGPPNSSVEPELLYNFSGFPPLKFDSMNTYQDPTVCQALGDQRSITSHPILLELRWPGRKT